MIEVRIDELVLDGASQLKPEAIRAATERELTRPSSQRPTPASDSLDTVRVARELAEAVRREVTNR